MDANIQKSIFITNSFATQNEAEHIRLWSEFEKEIPARNRTGYYGADNVAYVKWLSDRKEPAFIHFAQNQVRSNHLSSE